MLELKKLPQNQMFRSFIGMGYHDCITTVIQRNILENPAGTAYHLSARDCPGTTGALNFQTMIIDLTGLEIANASLLDEAAAAGKHDYELASLKSKAKAFFCQCACIPDD